MSVKNICYRFITLALLGMAVAQDVSAQNAVINVTGSLINPTCTVENKTISIDFGEFTVNGITSLVLATRSTTIKLINCSADTTQVIASLSGTQDGNGFKNIGTADGVYISAKRGVSDNIDLVNNGIWPQQVNSNTRSIDFSFNFSLKRRFGGGVSFDEITPGIILSVVNVSFSYS